MGSSLSSVFRRCVFTVNNHLLVYHFLCFGNAVVNAEDFNPAIKVTCLECTGKDPTTDWKQLRVLPFREGHSKVLKSERLRTFLTVAAYTAIPHGRIKELVNCPEFLDDKIKISDLEKLLRNTLETMQYIPLADRENFFNNYLATTNKAVL